MKLTPAQRLFAVRMISILAFVAAIFVVTSVALRYGNIANAPTVGFSFLIVVLFAAFFTDLPVAIVTSLVASLCFNFFFLPPIGTFTIAAFDDWISLGVFLLTSIAISRLTSAARANDLKAQMLTDTMARLQEFGTWLVSVPDDRLTLSQIADQALNHLKLEYCSIHVYREGKWHHYSGKATSEISREVAGRLNEWEDRPTKLMDMIDEHALGVRYMQINQGASPLALLVLKSEHFPAGAEGPLGYMIGARLVEVLRDRDGIGTFR